MTENVIQPKRNHGRPKKYHNDEDRRLAYNRQIKRMHVEKHISL